MSESSITTLSELIMILSDACQLPQSQPPSTNDNNNKDTSAQQALYEKQAQHLNALEFLHSFLTNTATTTANDENFSSLTTNNEETCRNIRQILWISCVWCTTTTTTSSTTNEKNPAVFLNNNNKYKELVWGTFHKLLVHCGGKWLLEEEKETTSKSRNNPNKNENKKKLARTLVYLVSSCVNEISIQFFLLNDKNNKTNNNDNEMVHNMNVLSYCLQVIKSVLQYLLSLSSFLLDDDDDDVDEKETQPPDWEGLPFDALLHIKDSLDRVHILMIDLLASHNDDNDEDITTQQAKYSCISCLTLWLAETELEEVLELLSSNSSTLLSTSTSTNHLTLFQKAIHNILILLDYTNNHNTKEENERPSQQLPPQHTTTIHDFLPALSKIISAFLDGESERSDMIKLQSLLKNDLQYASKLVLESISKYDDKKSEEEEADTIESMSNTLIFLYGYNDYGTDK